MTHLYNKMVSEKAKLKENNDCSVIAVAIACNVDYKTAHGVLAHLGRKYKDGVSSNMIKQAIEVLGNQYVQVPNPRQKNGCLYTPTTVKSRFKQGNYIIMTKGHAAALVDGVVHDWTKGRRHRIIEIIRVV